MSGTFGVQMLFPESVSNVTATNSIALGTRRMEGGNEYVYVYNAGTTAAVGYGLVASCNSGYSCTVTSVAGDVLFGVVANADLTTSNYGWAVVKGPAHIYSVNAIAAGAPVTLGAAGAFEQVLTALAGGTHALCGAATTAIASAATGLAWVRGIA
jgi:hypothetical protein